MSEIEDVVKDLESKYPAKFSLERIGLLHCWELRCYPVGKSPFGIQFNDLPMSPFVIKHFEKELRK